MAQVDAKVQTSAQQVMSQLLERVRSKWPNFRQSEGQLQMMNIALQTFVNAHTPDLRREGANLAAIDAPTGTGKTLGYLIPAFAASMATGRKVVVSTATVALQEQLYTRDLPQLAAIAGSELTFDILKGRQRYACVRKLDGLLAGESAEGLDDDDEHSAQPPPAAQGSISLQELRQRLKAGRWNGERDSLDENLADAQWRSIEADRSNCLGRRCESYQACSFYGARKRATDARVLVANHALVLSTLATESKLLNPTEALFVFDEGHHLPDIALDQFATRVNLGRLRTAANRGKGLVSKIAATLGAAGRPVDAQAARGAFQHLERTAGRVLSDLAEVAVDGVTRFPAGVITRDWENLCRELLAFVLAAHGFAEQSKTELVGITPASQQHKASIDRLVLDLGPVLLTIADAKKLLTLWLKNDSVPLAKWYEHSEQTGATTLAVSALSPAKALASGLWSKVAGAVVTSATLTSCGDFALFSRLSGLGRFAKHTQVRIQSPFNYQTQARLHIPRMRSTPKAATAREFSEEFKSRLPEWLQPFRGGQLVLFSSRAQMESTYRSLPAELQARVLMQGSAAPRALLQEHKARVQRGESSILFGLQSFGEGIDLPGKLCEHVVIDKIPFAPPGSPVDEALAEWLQSQQRSAFDEISVPKAGRQLVQWAGRAVRTTTDQAVITICDNRIKSASYGKKIMRGLPQMPEIAGLDRPFG